MSVPSQNEQDMDETRFFRSQTGYMGIHRRMFKKLDDEWEPDSDDPYDDSPSVDEDRVEAAAKRMALKIWVTRNRAHFEEKIDEFIFPPSLVERARRYRKRLLKKKKKKVLACVERQEDADDVAMGSDTKENAMNNVQETRGDAIGKRKVSCCPETAHWYHDLLIDVLVSSHL